MNREDIIRMAREVGMQGILTDVVTTIYELERFATLAAEWGAKQERIAESALKEPAIRARGEVPR